MMRSSHKPHVVWVVLVNILATLLTLSATASSENERVLGHVDAPVKLIEYGSLTCDHCIRFHREVLPIIQSRYIDSGQVRFIFRDFPTSKAAERGAVAAHCAVGGYYDMLKILFLKVGQWSRADNMDDVLVQLTEPLSIDKKQFDACLKNPNKSNQVRKAQQTAREKFDVLGTPTFLINGKIVSGKKSIEEMEILIDDALLQPGLSSKTVKE